MVIKVIINFIEPSYYLPSKTRRSSLTGRVRRTLAALLWGLGRNKHLPELGEGQLGPPDFLLAAESVSADEAEPKVNAHN